MSDKEKILVMVLCKDEDVRKTASTGIDEYLDDIAKLGCFDVKIDHKVVTSNVTGSSLIEAMREYDPQLTQRMLANDTPEVSLLKAELDNAKKQNDIKTAVLSQHLVEASLSDSVDRMRYSIDQALRAVQGSNYDQYLNTVAQQQLDDGCVDSLEEFLWPKGRAD